MHKIQRLGFTKIGNGKGTALLKPINTTNPKGNYTVYLPVFNRDTEYMEICSKWIMIPASSRSADLCGSIRLMNCLSSGMY